MRKLLPFVPVLLLGLCLACGGSSNAPAPATTPPPPAAQLATGLAYTDPAGTGWRLVKDASSTSTRIVLNLVGPAGLKSRGAGFNLRGPASVHFGGFPETGMAAKSGGIYTLLNTDPRDPMPPHDPIPNDPQEPVLLVGGVKAGNLLSVAIFQKDRRAGAKESGAALLKIALEFDPAAKLSVGDALALTITKAKYMAEDIGAFSGIPTPELIAKAKLVDMSIAVGSLHAN